MRVAVLTSGGDAPEMNAAVRAVARTAFYLGWEVTRVEAGYKGLLEGQIGPMDRRRLGGIVQRGVPCWAPSARRNSRPQKGKNGQSAG